MTATDTVMSSAFTRAGLNTAEFRLRQAAQDALAKHHGNVDRALTTFIKALECDADALRAALRPYLLPVGRAIIDSPASGACRQPNGNVVGHASRGPQSTSADALRPSRDGADHDDTVARESHVRPVREPSPEQRAAAARVANSIALTCLDSFKVRDGRAIGDVRIGELERLRSANSLEASVIRQIQMRGFAAHDSRVRDVVKSGELERIIQRAAEVADAG